MKFILSFLITGALLSAGPSAKLSLGNAALTTESLCAPVNILTPPTPIKCPLPTLQLPTTPTIQCNNLPVVPQCPLPVTTAPVTCQPTPTPVIENPGTPHAPSGPSQCPSSATPEPASFALVGAGLMAAGLVRKFRKQ